jgi:putative heme-binding domain-containing protein
MTLHTDEQIKALVRKHWGKVRGGTPAEKQQEIARVAELLRDKPAGQAEAGKLVFTKRCATCHTLFGEGGKAGPDLTGYERTNLDFMLLAVVDPSAAIREEFTNFAVVTKDGRTLTGLVEEQNPRTVTLRGVDGQTTLVNRDDIETLAAVPVSLMPDGLMSQLTEAEIRDLFAYLMSRTPSRTLSGE